MARILVWVLGMVVTAATGCANQERPPPSATPEPLALAPAGQTVPCPAAPAASPRATVNPPTAEALDAAFGPALTKPGWIQLSIGKAQYQLDAFEVSNDAKGDRRHVGPPPGPYAQVKDPSSSKPAFWLVADESHGLEFNAGGTSLHLPGKLEDAGFRISNVATGEDWVSTDGVLEVTEFGADGQVVAGSFYGTMSARLNRHPERIVGRFRVFRHPDRFSP